MGGQESKIKQKALVSALLKQQESPAKKWKGNLTLKSDNKIISVILPLSSNTNSRKKPQVRDPTLAGYQKRRRF